MRDQVAVKRNPTASPEQLAAYHAGRLPNKVLCGTRLYTKGEHPYDEEVAEWTTESRVRLNRAMSNSAGKQRYMTLLCEALVEQTCCFMGNATKTLVVEVDGPCGDAPVDVIRLGPCPPDTIRSPLRRSTRPRGARYGEASSPPLPHTTRPKNETETALSPADRLQCPPSANRPNRAFARWMECDPC